MSFEEIRLPTLRGELAALRSGNPDGPKLLALHGWLDNAASFIPVFPQFAGFDLVALDLPGHGHSAHRLPGYDYAFIDWMHDILDAMDVLGWSRANLLGHSLGGAIASCVAACAPERVQRLALIEALGPLAGAPGEAGERLRAAVKARRERGAREDSAPRRIDSVDIALAARMNATPMPREGARLIVERNLRPVEGGFVWRSDARLTLPSAVRLPEDAVQAILRQITVPTFLVAAEPSPPYFSAEIRDARRGCVADIRVLTLPGGHHLHMEQPELVGGLLADFLAAP